MSVRFTHKLCSVIVLLSLALQPLVAAGKQADQATGSQGVSASAASGLYRTTVTVDSPARRARLEALGVMILAENTPTPTLPLPGGGSEGRGQVVVLADADQLESLARLGFRPQTSDDLAGLTAVAAPEKAWLTASLKPLLAQAEKVQAQRAAMETSNANVAAVPDGITALRAAMQALTPEQAAGIASYPSNDFDGDGLTDTEEAWWCTDPTNRNSDGDPSGYTDGQEVDALLDFTLPRTTRKNYGPPFGPPAAWPNFNNRDGSGMKVCNDGDYDTIPDYAEAYVVGTRVGTGDSENTDGDKYDDGQEFFGITFCLPGQPNCGYGLYPRNQDFNFITNGMPEWIRPPGDSPFVAAYPVIDFLVDPATIEVTTKEIRTIERTITQGEEIATGFAETQGNSTTVGTVDTNTHSTWQENSTTEGGIEPATVGTSVGMSFEMRATRFLNNPIPEYPPLPLSQNGESKQPTGLIVASPSAITILPGPAQTEDGVAEAVRQALASAPNALAISDQFTISALDDRGSEWLLVTVAALKDIKDSGSWNVADNAAWFGLVILKQEADGRWSGAVEGTREFTLMLDKVPDAVLNARAKQSLDPLRREALAQGSWEFGYDFPWKPGTKMLYSQGPHTNGKFGWIAIDLASAGGLGFAPNEIRAARGGNIKLLCHDHLGQAWIQIDNLTYLHLVYDDRIHRDGEPRMTGDYLGALMVGPIANDSDHCGYSTQNASTYHLHFGIESLPITFEGWELRSDGTWYQGTKTITPGQNISASGDLASDPCNVSSVKSTDPTPNTLPATQKRTSFIEVIGRTLKSWWGKLTGASALAQATGLDASPPGCSGGSCTSQIGGGGNYNLNFSDSRSAGQCGGNSSPGGGSDGGVGGGGSGLAFNDTGSAMESLRVWSQTTTNGEGWSTSHSELRSETQYSEITRSRTNTLVSSEAWSTATTVDPTDAAALTFNYNLYNTGSDAAVRLTGIKINILIGDLPVITQNLSDSFDILPGGAKGPFGSGQIKLTLDQLAAIDNGAPIRVVLADYGYDDNLYDTNAWGRSVLFHVDDGTADGDETVDTYLITTNLVQGETYQDTLARYFAVSTFQSGDERNGTITNIRTPEFAPDGEITGWNDHPVNEHGWWELSISLGGETAGVKHFKEMPAKPKTDVYLRYVLDTDADGYTDRAERDAGTDPVDPQSHPKVLLAVAQHTVVSSSAATVQVSLQNEGNFDASSVELWAIAPDDSITINDNLVGGGGRVRAGRQVVLGARIGKPDLANWKTSRAKPYPGGQFEGTNAKTFTFRADATGNVGVTAGLTISWSSTGGAPWTALAVGSGYTPWTALPLSDGLTIAFSGDYIAQGETFTFATALPMDTFSYTINRTPYSKPLIIASYNDPEGNHKFVSDVEVARIQDDLASYLGDMRYGFQMDVMGQTMLNAGANTAYIVFNNPSDTTISSGNVFVEFATPDGLVAREYVLANQIFQPGPNLATLNWNTADFSPAFDPAQDYHILAFAADRQGTIFENTVKDLDQLGKDKLPAFAMSAADAAWDFGAAAQGTLLKRSFTFANTGALDLLTYVSAPAGLTVSQTGSRRVGMADMTTYEMALNTADLGVGPYTGDIIIRTSDPDARERTVHVVGTVTAAPADTPVGAMQRPLDWPAPVSGTQGQWVEFTHTLGPEPQTLHPVKVYSQDYASLKGVGKYATPFGAGTASYDMFGDGRDGVMPSSGNLDYNNGVGVGIVNSGSAGTYFVSVTDAYAGWRINAGDAVLIHQTQGTGAGCWELNKAVSDYAGGTASIQLSKPLQCTYYAGGNNHAQIQRVPQYTDCPVSGTVTPLSGWNGTWGGIFAVLCNGAMNITGSINASGYGFRGGCGGSRGSTGGQVGCQGEGVSGPGGRTWPANGAAGGGGEGDYYPNTGCVGHGGGGGSYQGTGGNGGYDREHPHQAQNSSGPGGPDDLSAMFLGSGGGGGGADADNNAPGTAPSGGSGGGIVIIYGKQIQVTGAVAANGQGGGNTYNWTGGGGGGGGGAIYIVGSTISRQDNQVQSLGGGRGINTNEPNGWEFYGGYGSNGRIHTKYCESVIGATNPWGSQQKLNCYITEQIESAPYTSARLNLPASGTSTYQVQYGRKLNWSGAASQEAKLRVPAGLFTSVTLQALISDLPSNAWFALDIGNTGSDSWNGTVGNGGEYTSPNLAAFFNAYWAGHGAPTTGTLDVPIRVTLDRAGQVLLTNLQVTPTGSKVRAIRLPVRPQGYSSVTASFTVSGGTGPLAVGVDVGGDGSVDWTYTGSPAYPASLTAQGPDLTAAFNAYLAGKPDPTDVPIRFTLSPFATLNLTGFSATPVGQPDASISVGDITFNAPAPTEGNEVTVSATIHNTGTLDTGPLVVAFYATPPGQSETQIGSAFVPSVPASFQLPASIPWHTLGFTGETSVQVTVDPFNRVAEASETNNQAAASLTIKTRPDLVIPTITLSDNEPVADEPVTVTMNLANSGQTDTADFVASLSDGESQVGSATSRLSAAASAAAPFTWMPAAPGLHRLAARADRDQQVNESDEGNNDRWLDVYVGFAGPLLLDSGGITQDPPYTTMLGYGAVDEGQPDVLSACSPSASPADTFRRDPAGRVVYRFDHLLPGHFYHLDTTLYECDGAHRQETVKADGNTLLGPVDLSDGQAHRFSTRLDPALYADRSISVTVEAPGINGAVVSQVNLYDVDYRYADAGASGDLAYSAQRGYGWLDGVANAAWGGLPYQNVRVNQSGNTLRYRFDSLAAAKRYQVNLTLFQGDAVNVIEEILVDGLATGVVANLGDRQPHYLAVDVPVEAYRGDGSVTVTIRRTNGATGAFANEISLEEKTLLNLPAISDVRVTNVTAERATVSWLTDAATDGAIHYGPTAALGGIVLDERGAPVSSRTHQVTLVGLTPQTTYHFYAISSDTIDDLGGAYYSFTTGPAFAPNPSDLAFGRVLRSDGTTPAAGALVRARMRDADAQGSLGDSAALSALADGSGYWSFDLAATRTTDYSQLFEYSLAGDRLYLEVTDGTGCAASQVVDTGLDAPAPDVILVCPTQATHTIANGWTLLALNVQSDPAPTAEAVLDDIADQGSQAIEIERWWNGGWDAHVRDLPFNNFTLTLGRGYFVRTGSAGGWTRTGLPLVAPLTLNLYSGWNLVGLPKFSGALSAEDLLVGIAAQGGACSEVDRWINSGWLGHPKGYPVNNFAIATTEGYFVKCTKQSAFTPGASAASSRMPTAPPAAEGSPEQPAAVAVISDVLVTNRRDVAFTVSWRTDQPSKGWIEYGPPGVLGLIERDPAGGPSTLHHITVADLSPETVYAYRVHAGDQVADKDGQPFHVTTAATTAPGVPLTAFGQVLDNADRPIIGALVRAWLVDGNGARSEPLSTLTEGDGYWGLSLPADACADQQLFLQVFAADGATAQRSGSACDAQPAPALTLQVQPRIPIYLPLVGR